MWKFVRGRVSVKTIKQISMKLGYSMAGALFIILRVFFYSYVSIGSGVTKLHSAGTTKGRSK